MDIRYIAWAGYQFDKSVIGTVGIEKPSVDTDLLSTPYIDADLVISPTITALDLRPRPVRILPLPE